jgi:signal transduction histidine kinase
MTPEHAREAQDDRKAARRSTDDGLLMSVLYEVIEYWPHAVLLAGRGGACLPNANALQLFGLRQDEVVVGDRLIAALDLRCCDSRRTLRIEEYPSQRALQGEYVVHDFLVHDKRSGDEMALRCSAQPIRTGGEIVGALVTWVDISDLRRSTERIRQSSRELQQFSAIASHDLQQPIRNMRCYLDLLRLHLASVQDETTVRLLDQAEQGAIRLQRLLDNLLDLTRIERQEGRRRQVDCSDVMRDVLTNLEDEIREAEAEVVFRDPPTVLADRTLLLVLLQNLVSNSLKYRHPERPCRVLIAVCRLSHETLFSVNDNGVGIENEYLDEIFKPFRRIDSSTGLAGSGLGLDICRRIVAAHEGRIWAESTPGTGSTFFFTLGSGHDHAALEKRIFPPEGGAGDGS